MATISKSGIEPGKIIKSEHLIRIINALAASSSADIKVSGSVSSSLYYGDGRFLTNVSASNITNVLGDVEPWHVPYLNGNANAFQNSPIHVTSSLVNGVETSYVAINTTASFEIESRAPEALLVYQDNPDSYTVIRGEGLVDNYFQIDVKNFNTGSSASSDLVATANNGTESDMYVNVGINNQGYAVEGSLGGPNDVYVYGLGQKMVIGNARSGASGSVAIFAGGFDTEIYRKLFIDPNNRHNITGSLAISESLDVKQGAKITGSFNVFGAVTASNLPPFGISSSYVPYLTLDGGLRNSAIYQSSSLVGGSPVSFVVINSTGSRDAAAPEALLVRQNDPGSYNIIAAEGIANSYVQLNIINSNSGSGASADIVATNNIGSESEYYVDMGINSSNYDIENVVGGPNDAYLYSTGAHLHIGNGSANQPVMFFAGGLNADVHQKLYLDPSNHHQMTGSLYITGSVYIQGNNQLYINGTNISSSIQDKHYGAFSDLTDQSGSINQSGSFQYHTTDYSNEVSIQNNERGLPTRIQVATAGVFNLQFSTQIVQGAGSADVYIWFKKNGSNIPNSATVVTVPSNQKLVAAWNFIESLNAGDYLEIAYQSDSGNTTYPYIAASGNKPGVPSIIVTLTQVS